MATLSYSEPFLAVANRLVLLSQQAPQSTSLPRQGNVLRSPAALKGPANHLSTYDGAPP
jgi:hypothetical protein